MRSPRRTPVVTGACVNCNTPLSMVLGIKLDDARYVLERDVWCPHCEFWCSAAIKDFAGRYWARRRAWND